MSQLKLLVFNFFSRSASYPIINLADPVTVDKFFSAFWPCKLLKSKRSVRFKTLPTFLIMALIDEIHYHNFIPTAKPILGTMPLVL